MVLLFAWPPVRGVCLNHEVMIFQSRKVTPRYLGSVLNCYLRYSTLLNPLLPLRPPPDLCLGGGCPHPPLTTILSTSVVQPHRIIFPPERHLSPSQHPNTHRSLPYLLNTHQMVYTKESINMACKYLRMI